jgi:hypothetical protein
MWQPEAKNVGNGRRFAPHRVIVAHPYALQSCRAAGGGSVYGPDRPGTTVPASKMTMSLGAAALIVAAFL